MISTKCHKAEIQPGCSFKKTFSLFSPAVCSFIAKRMISEVTRSQWKRSASRPWALVPMSSAAGYFYSVGDLVIFPSDALFHALICIAKWHCIRGASLLQRDSRSGSCCCTLDSQHSAPGLAPNRATRRSTFSRSAPHTAQWLLSQCYPWLITEVEAVPPPVGTTSRLSIWTLPVLSWSHSG